MNSQDRGPAKRKVKPVEAPSLLDFDLGEGESSDDSDFRIEDHAEESDDYSINTDDEKKQDDNSGSSEEESESEEEDTQFKSSNKMGEEMSVAELLERAKQQDFQFPGDIANVLICSGCLGSRSDDFNEIVECDGCGVTVHEGCYGVSDVTSESSTVSSASTEPWFCEACKAGVTDPSCELCPNKGGIFKETEVGRWVHLVCALYVPGVAFSEVERLSGVTLFEMAYSGWGARRCALCRDAASARTGVAVGCDAGLCRTFFHVTCGQREGLLAEAHSEEAEQADPFYAHCKLHSDKALVKKRKRNWLALQLRTAKRKLELQNNLSEEEKKRIQRKLVKYTRKYQQQKENRNPPWVPTQKMARMLYSSASAMRAFQRKAECMGVDIHTLEFQDKQMAALKDVSRRWHIPPAFSVEFVGYYLERNSRVTSLRDMLQKLTKENETLVADNERLRIEYDEAAKENSEKLTEFSTNKLSLRKLYDAIVALCPKKATPAILDEQPLLPPEVPRSTPKVTPQQLQKRSKPVPTAAALKMGVGFPLSDHPHARCGKVLSTSCEASAAVAGVAGAGAAGQCAVCGARGAGAAGVLVTCDTCQRGYHLGCVNPPLARPPKKSKLYGWQCSECDKTSDSEPEVMEKKQPRRSRIRYSKDGAIISEPRSPELKQNTPSPKNKHKTKKITKLATPSADNASPIKLTIKPFEFSESESEIKSFKREKKIKKSKSKDFSGETSDPTKKLKRSFTSPNLTNTPLMSITPIVADSPNDSHNENSNASTTVPPKREESFSSHLSFSSLLGEQKEKEKERDSKAIESSIENTLANLSSDIATYKANRKRRKEKHRSRYSPDFMRSPSKHKHKRKKKNQDMENPGLPHPRITIKIKPIPKPDGSLAPQMFYVPSDSNDAPPSHHTHKHKHHSDDTTPAATESSAPPEPIAEDSTLPEEKVPEEVPNETTVNKPKRGRGGRGSSTGGGGGAAGASGVPLTPMTECDVCAQPGTTANLVRCDECSRRYHFSCLEPPLARNPKKRGYSWHCADCDPTDQEEIN